MALVQSSYAKYSGKINVCLKIRIQDEYKKGKLRINPRHVCIDVFRSVCVRFWAIFAHTHTHHHHHHHVVQPARITLTFPCHPSLSLIVPGRSSRHRAVVYSFQLVFLPLLVHVMASTGVCRLWVRPYFVI